MRLCRVHARDKIDGSRFDLYSFHFVYNMQHIQCALAVTLVNDGIDGSKITFTARVGRMVRRRTTL